MFYNHNDVSITKLFPSNQQSTIQKSLDSLANSDFNEMKSEILTAVRQLQRDHGAGIRFGTLPAQLNSLAAKGKRLSTEQHILNSLRFQAMKLREANISKAHQRTFE